MKSTLGIVLISAIAPAGAAGLTTGVIVKAIQDESKKATITFDLNDLTGKTIKQKIWKGETPYQPQDPTREDGAIFVGWYTAKPDKFNHWDETMKFDFTQVIEENTTVYARWGNEFNNIGWKTVTDKISAFEDQYNDPTVDTAKTLLMGLGWAESEITVQAQDTAQTLLQRNIVGAVGSMQINGLIHYVRCIDAMHDDLADGTATVKSGKAALSFQLDNILSLKAEEPEEKNQYDYYSCQWGGSNSNYTASTLRNNLNSNNGAVWYVSDSISKFSSDPIDDNRSCIQMLQDTSTGSPIVAEAIKSTKHYVAINNEGWEEVSYNDKLFALNVYSVSTSRSRYCQETPENNPIYKYFDVSTEEELQARRTRKDLDGKGCYYNLASACTKYSSVESLYVWNIFTGGSITDFFAQMYSAGIAFAFAI